MTLGILIGNRRYPWRIFVYRLTRVVTETHSVLPGYFERKEGIVITYYKELGNRIKMLRESRGMTQEGLGSILGIQKAAVAKIESGKSANMRIDKLMLLCRTFNMFPASLLYGDSPTLWTSVFNVEIGSDVIPLEETAAIAKIHAIAEVRFGPKGIALLDAVSGLNEKGVERAAAYLNDLAKIKEYRRSGGPD